MGVVPIRLADIKANLEEIEGGSMPKRTPPEIIAVKQTKYDMLLACPKCDKDLGNTLDANYKLCARCNLIVYAAHSFNVGTVNGPKPTLQEIRDFLHPPEQRTLADVADEYQAARGALYSGKPIIVGDDTSVISSGSGPIIIPAPLPRSEPPRKLSKYQPRPLAPDREPSPWLWRTLYAVITMTAAALTLWQALRVI